MNKYIKKFKSTEELLNFVNSPDYITPNLYLVEGLGTVSAKKLEPLAIKVISGSVETKSGNGCAAGVRLLIPSEITSNQLDYVEFSVDDGKTWERYTVPDTPHDDISFGPTNLCEGDIVLFRGKGRTLVTESEEEDWIGCQFVFDNVNEAQCRGDVLSLLNVPLDLFKSLFQKSSKSRSAGDNGQFWGLFENAPITIMPKLIDDALFARDFFGNGEFYQGMFANSRIGEVFLPSKYVPSGCYDYMFDGCQNIDEITILAEEWEDEEFPTNMFNNTNIFSSTINLYIPKKMFSWYKDEQGVISSAWNVYDYETEEVLQQGEVPALEY